MAWLREDLRYSYGIIEFGDVTAELAVKSAKRHRLCAYGCLQFAGLLLQRQRGAFGLAPLVLLSAAEGLNDVAVFEGWLVDDPAASP